MKQLARAAGAGLDPRPKVHSSPASQLTALLFSLGALGMGTPTLLCPIPRMLICLCPILSSLNPFLSPSLPLPFLPLNMSFSGPYFWVSLLMSLSLSPFSYLLSQLSFLSFSSHLYPGLCLSVAPLSQSSLFLPFSLCVCVHHHLRVSVSL